MVYVNNKKFACESCIKGHRSSSCHHTDRPLFEIKKKGRPISQCTSCRELRQSKKVHSKCTCDPSSDKLRQEQLVPLSAGSKSKRYIPIVPALPNGLRDALQSTKVPAVKADSRQRVDTLLNPCKCNSLWACNCMASVSSTNYRLETLAHAASLQASTPLTSASVNPPPMASKTPRIRTPSPPHASHIRINRNSLHTQSPGPSLPPIRTYTPLVVPPLTSTLSTESEIMPSINEIKSLAGTSCTCGVQCACPGCVEHRGPGHASEDHRDCADGCGTCIDHSVTELRFNLGGPTIVQSALPPASFLDQFFARAAALPPPPLYRRLGLDPTDTSSFRALDSHQSVVSLPKLDCCGGSCLCPSGGCTCGSSCGGTCLDHRFRITQTIESPVEVAEVAPRSCCAGKAVL